MLLSIPVHVECEHFCQEILTLLVGYEVLIDCTIENFLKYQGEGEGRRLGWGGEFSGPADYQSASPILPSLLPFEKLTLKRNFFKQTSILIPVHVGNGHFCQTVLILKVGLQYWSTLPIC